jgi:predicted branched-subunit amino acid permease
MSDQDAVGVAGISTGESGLRSALHRATPVGIALFPVGLLFGVLAEQVGWRATDILLMSLIGFTGSGQFALLKFVQEGVGYAVAFLVILCMNLRYVPMALSASRPLPLSGVRKFLMSHFVSDESYAAERRGDSVLQRAVVRAIIVFFWTSSTVCGVVAAAYVPEAAKPYVIGLTFPISALLFLLSALNVLGFVRAGGSRIGGRVAAVVASALISLAFMGVLGTRYFWIPGIVVSFFLLGTTWRARA